MGRETEKWESLDPRLLRDAFGRVDPMPPGLTEDLEKALELRRHGTELARLSAEDESGTPSDASAAGPVRTVVFESDRCSVTAAWSPAAGNGSQLVELDGSVERAVPAALLIETPDQTINGNVDGQRIRAEGVHHGPVRLCLIMSSGDEPWLVETEWITV
jgi:hypothetical protein